MKNYKILIIEDSFIVSELLKFTLQKSPNFQIDVCNSIADIDKHDHNYDIMLLDHYLGKSKGIQLTGLDLLINRKKWLCNVPVIIFSSQKDNDIAIKYIEEGAINYISKDEDDFIDKIQLSIHSIIDNIQSQENLQNIREQTLQTLKKNV
jgi:response regulator of citrate/malate metabolism